MARWLPSETQVAIWAPTTSRVVNSTPRESLATCASAPVCGPICTIADNGRIGFRDNLFDGIFGGREKLGDYMEELDREECLQLFDEYMSLYHDTY